MTRLNGVTIFVNKKNKYSILHFESVPGNIKYKDETLKTADSLLEIRKFVPKNMKIKLPRKDDDDKSIVETWI